MPYISAKDDRREKLRNGEPALTAGELNYQIFWYVKHTSDLGLLEVDIKSFVAEFLGDKPNYQRYNDMTGALIRCKKEILRRISTVSIHILILLNEIIESYDEEIAKYEDEKIISNGDVE